MNNPYNQLTDAEAERLAILSEELAEASKCIGKILRHGYESFDPTGKEPGTNREQLATELGQISAEIASIALIGDIHGGTYTNSWNKRQEKIKNKVYRHHQ